MMASVQIFLLALFWAVPQSFATALGPRLVPNPSCTARCPAGYEGMQMTSGQLGWPPSIDCTCRLIDIPKTEIIFVEPEPLPAEAEDELKYFPQKRPAPPPCAGGTPRWSDGQWVCRQSLCYDAEHPVRGKVDGLVICVPSWAPSVERQDRKVCPWNEKSIKDPRTGEIVLCIRAPNMAVDGDIYHKPQVVPHITEELAKVGDYVLGPYVMDKAGGASEKITEVVRFYQDKVEPPVLKDVGKGVAAVGKPTADLYNYLAGGVKEVWQAGEDLQVKVGQGEFPGEELAIITKHVTWPLAVIDDINKMSGNPAILPGNNPWAPKPRDDFRSLTEDERKVLIGNLEGWHKALKAKKAVPFSLAERQAVEHKVVEEDARAFHQSAFANGKTVTPQMQQDFLVSQVGKVTWPAATVEGKFDSNAKNEVMRRFAGHLNTAQSTWQNTPKPYCGGGVGAMWRGPKAGWDCPNGSGGGQPGWTAGKPAPAEGTVKTEDGMTLKVDKPSLGAVCDRKNNFLFPDGTCIPVRTESWSKARGAKFRVKYDPGAKAAIENIHEARRRHYAKAKNGVRGAMETVQAEMQAYNKRASVFLLITRSGTLIGANKGTKNPLQPYEIWTYDLSSNGQVRDITVSPGNGSSAKAVFRVFKDGAEGQCVVATPFDSWIESPCKSYKRAPEQPR